MSQNAASARDPDSDLEHEHESTAHGFSLPLVLETFSMPAFALDSDGTVVAANERIASLLSVPQGRLLGSDSVGAELYDARQRTLTLAEKIARAPRNTQAEYPGVDRANDEYALLDGDDVYEDTSVINGTDIWFVATPVFRDGEFVGVIEIVQDITNSARYHQELEDLFEALTDAIAAHERGEFSAEVQFDTENSILEDEFLHIVDAIEAMGATIDEVVREIRSDARQFQQTTDDIADQSRAINANSSEQAERMTTVSSEVSDLSATVEEIASTTRSVAETSAEAERRAIEGNETATEAVDSLEGVATSAEDVAADVKDLRSQVTTIDEIVAVIDEIADQTNLLALNASIEAARAGEAGDGFAVVADEIKSLAEESQAHAAEIETTVDEIQSTTTDTADNLLETTDRIETSIERVEEAMDRFDEIVEAVTDVADGIQQVADATDEQADSAEEISTMIDRSVDLAETISQSVDEIAANTQQQAAMVSELNESVDKLHGSNERR